MVVRVNSRRLGMRGLHVGDGNVQRLFPPDVPIVELELDHLRIVCNLQPEFWDGDPEIHDERLVTWLESKRVSGKLDGGFAPVAMIPAGDHAFRLQPLDRKEVQTAKHTVVFAA